MGAQLRCSSGVQIPPTPAVAVPVLVLSSGQGQAQAAQARAEGRPVQHRSQARGCSQRVSSSPRRKREHPLLPAPLRAGSCPPMPVSPPPPSLLFPVLLGNSQPLCSLFYTRTWQHTVNSYPQSLGDTERLQRGNEVRGSSWKPGALGAVTPVTLVKKVFSPVPGRWHSPCRCSFLLALL